MRQFLSAVSLALLTLSAASATGVSPSQIKNLVTFGDSYTDVQSTADGGVVWPDYTARYAQVTLFPFARAGATCSLKLTPSVKPSLFESQLPLYFAEHLNGSLELAPEETIYTLWLGVNDIGAKALLTGSVGASIVDISSCMVNWVKALYDNGARNFIFQNMPPLQYTPMYSPNAYPCKYWTGSHNATEWSVFITELVLAGNAITKFMLQELAPTLPGAQIGLFDSHALFDDMYHNPALYLNGTVPWNVTGAIDSCVYEVDQSSSAVGECTIVSGTARDSYLWYDELHPSEQANRIVAREIAEVVQGQTNIWTTWL